MGIDGLSATAQTWRLGPRSVEYPPVGPRARAIVEDTRPGLGVTSASLRELGGAEPCRTVGIQFIEPPDTRPVRAVAWKGGAVRLLPIPIGHLSIAGKNK